MNERIDPNTQRPIDPAVPLGVDPSARRPVDPTTAAPRAARSNWPILIILLAGLVLALLVWLPVEMSSTPDTATQPAAGSSTTTSPPAETATPPAATATPPATAPATPPVATPPAADTTPPATGTAPAPATAP